MYIRSKKTEKLDKSYVNVIVYYANSHIIALLEFMFPAIVSAKTSNKIIIV